MSETRFPLDAEQIVRLVAWAVAKHVDAVRLPAEQPIDAAPPEFADAGAFAVELGELLGIRVQHYCRPGRPTTLLRYVPPTPRRPTAPSASPDRGAGDAG